MSTNREKRLLIHRHLARWIEDAHRSNQKVIPVSTSNLERMLEYMDGMAARLEVLQEKQPALLDSACSCPDGKHISGRACTEEIKTLTTKTLLTVWLQQPQLRLGQLIANVIDLGDLFYLEDAALVSLLTEYVQKLPTKE